jgi:hypothetical protein
MDLGISTGEKETTVGGQIRWAAITDGIGG